jgi:DNA-binding MarR family transcriptional regulator
MNLGDLYQLGRRLKDEAERAMTGGHDLGLSPAETIVIADLLEHPDSTISDIVSRTAFAQSRVSLAVADLRRRGWVETATDAADRRFTRVLLARWIGHKAAEVKGRSAEPLLAELLSGLEPERREEIVGALETLHSALVVGRREQIEAPGR